MPAPFSEYNASSTRYRYGFNGKENDNEVKGAGNQQDYGMRIYDPRLGRFLSVDRITKNYPNLTPYQFASNKPINSIDRDGLEGWETQMALDFLWWIMDDPIGAKQAKGGAERYVATQAGLQSFQQQGMGPSDPVSQRFSNNLEKNVAFTDMAAGGAKYTQFLAETWASALPVEEGTVLALRGIASTSGKIFGRGAQLALENTATILEKAIMVKASPNESFFWSGTTNGVGGEIRALEIAKSKGGTTLEEIIRSRGIEMPKWDINNPETVKSWKDMSKAYAMQASGRVGAVIGKKVREDAIWLEELEVLKANKKVTEVYTIDPETLKETVIFKRK